MVKYKRIENPYELYEYRDSDMKIKEVDREWIKLLELLEDINPCGQNYDIVDDCMIVSYKFKLNLFNFKNIVPLRLNIEIIGLPISVSKQGYFGNPYRVKRIVENRKGLKLILNSDTPIKNGGQTLSSFIFHNKFKSFEEYISSLRSPYRRRLKIALSNRKKLTIKKIDKKDFSKEHYYLYISIMKRTQNALEILPIEFFVKYNAEIYEFLDRDRKRIVGFIQIKQIEEELLFLFGGFDKEDNKPYDLYYNMLLKIVEIGIERRIKTIEFGQTAEASKLKIGCEEKKKYLYIHHSNKMINKMIRFLLPFFSYKPYKIKHNVFKN